MVGIRCVFVMGVVVVMAVGFITRMGVMGAVNSMFPMNPVTSESSVDQMVLVNIVNFVNVMGFVNRMGFALFGPGLVLMLGRFLLGRLRMLDGRRSFWNSRDDGARCRRRFGAGVRQARAGVGCHMAVRCFRIVVPGLVRLLGNDVVAFAAQRLFLFAEFLAGQRPATMVTHGA
ncbi:hypothetical protein [Arthrobacter sp. 754]|uniref:hypothetical protein n=1 Tax=Arthrobacter sp. 754 TaxID=3156315 RepID=UPI0033963B64